MSAPNPQTDTFLGQFTTEVEGFLERTGMYPSVLGKAAVNDPAFVLRLRGGRSPSLKQADRVRAFMAAYDAEAATRGRPDDRSAA